MRCNERVVGMRFSEKTFTSGIRLHGKNEWKENGMKGKRNEAIEKQ